MPFKDFLQISAREIDFEIERFFTNWSNDVVQISSRLLPLVDALGDACVGGKRIRGTLVKLGYEMGGGKSKEILKVAAAVEIFQTAILSHDDIIDKSLLRRDRQSLYARLGGDHAGVSKAICLGDIGYFLAFQIIANSGFEEGQKSKVMGVFSKMMLETAVGELLDIELTGREGVVDSAAHEKEIINVCEYKTAQYTITGPLMIGAVLRGASEEQLDSIRIFGRNLGIAFQIRDDINDIFSERKRLGKELGGDIKEGKQTLLYLYAREHAGRSGREILNKYFGNSEIGDEEIDKVAQVFDKSGALEYVNKQVEEYAARAREAIVGITKDVLYRDMFLGMTEFLL